MAGPEVQGGTTDALARAGEGTTVRVLERRCQRCGARMEELTDAYTGEIKAIRCRGGCKPAVQTFAIPPGTKLGRCRSCGTPVYWIRTKAGRFMPVEPDGVSHFARCRQASNWRRQRGSRFGRSGSRPW